MPEKKETKAYCLPNFVDNFANLYFRQIILYNFVKPAT